MYSYLRTDQSDERYRVVSDFIKETGIVVDINAGEPRFKNFIKYDKYYANDIRQPDDTSGIDFTLCDDTEVDISSDLLCIWGYGGGEFTGEPLESKTAGETIIRLAEYNPEYIVLEMAQKWEDDFKIISTLTKKLTNYNVVLDKKLDIGDDGHYHSSRQIRILKIC